MLEGFLVANFVPLMFVGLLVFLLSGIPVAFALIGTGLTFGVLGMELGLFSPSLFSALSYRIYGIVQNETLLAVPFFTLMGLLLERSQMAEDLLEVVGHVFGPIRGGFAVAVVLVGAMLAATTGVIAAAVISMGLISLPIMLRYGYNRPIAAGVIAASGTLAQIVPPSLVLIVLADQLGRSVGDMYAGAMLPSVILIGLFLVFIAFVAVIRPHWVPAIPVSARIHREPSGSSGHASLLVLLILALLVGLGWAHFHDRIVERLIGREGIAATDEVVIISLMVATVFAYLLACVDLWLRLNWLSRLAKQVTFVMIPPIVLIFLVLGTIFLGIATPTEGGAMGAVGAFVMGVARRRLNLPLLTQAVDSTARLTVFVLFILIGATVFSFAFNAADGHEWVEALFKQLPGGQTGFLIAVCALVFVLGMFIDAFEIAFIVIPILTPVAVSMEVDLLWFGVIIGMILQTSFLTPPFGLALSYLRSVAPKTDGVDRKSGLDVKGVSTAQIYAGCIPFIALQILATAFVIYDPSFVLGPVNSGKAAPVAVDADTLMPPSMDTLMPPMSDLSN